MFRREREGGDERENSELKKSHNGVENNADKELI